MIVITCVGLTFVYFHFISHAPAFSVSKFAVGEALGGSRITSRFAPTFVASARSHGRWDHARSETKSRYLGLGEILGPFPEV